MAKGVKISNKTQSRDIVQTVNLTNAEIKALRATPKVLVPSFGPNAVVQFVQATLKLKYGGTNVFTETADNLAIRYSTTTGAIVSQTIETTGFIDQNVDTETSALPKIDAIVASSVSKGGTLVLHNTGDGEIAGNAGNDNTMQIVIAYKVIYFS